MSKSYRVAWDEPGPKGSETHSISVDAAIAWARIAAPVGYTYDTDEAALSDFLTVFGARLEEDV